MKDKKQELELSIISEETEHKHKVLERSIIERFTLDAQAEIEND